MISIVIPYMEQLAQGQGEDKELKYAIRSFEKHCKFDFDIVIIGDKPSWYVGNHIYTEKIRGMQFARCFDIANKLNHICQSNLITNDFIYTYDDVYCINDCSIEDFKKIIALGYLDRTSRLKDGSVNYRRLMDETIRAVDQDEFYHYETHLPRILNKNKLEILIKAYKLNKRPVLFSTLYFNEFYDKPDIILMDSNPVKAGIYTRLPYSEIVKRTKGYKWMNNSENAYNDGLQKFLKESFPNKSKFEK